MLAFHCYAIIIDAAFRYLPLRFRAITPCFRHAFAICFFVAEMFPCLFWLRLFADYAFSFR